MNIRPSTKWDDQFILAGMQELFAMHGAFHSSYEEIKEVPTGFYLIAESDEPVGILRGVFSEPTSMIYDVFVKPKYRNRGVGSALLERFKEMAKQKNSRHVVLATDIHNEMAQKFWRKHGFADFQIKMIQDI